MVFTDEPIVFNENDLFLYPTAGILLSETNELKVHPIYASNLISRVDLDTLIILGNKIKRHAFPIEDNTYLFNLCIDEICNTLVGAIQMCYKYDDPVHPHLLWQSCRVLVQRLKRAPDKIVHIEYPRFEDDDESKYDSVDKVLKTLPTNVFVHNRKGD